MHPCHHQYAPAKRVAPDEAWLTKANEVHGRMTTASLPK